jgi:hypothetical protein
LQDAALRTDVPGRPQHGRQQSVPGAQLAADPHVVTHRQVAKQAAGLKRPGQSRGRNLEGPQSDERSSPQAHRPAGRPVDAGEQIEDGGLARAIRPDETLEIAALQGQAEMLYGLQAAEGDREVGDFQEPRHGQQSHSAARPVGRVTR